MKLIQGFLLLMKIVDQVLLVLKREFQVVLVTLVPSAVLADEKVVRFAPANNT